MTSWTTEQPPPQAMAFARNARPHDFQLQPDGAIYLYEVLMREAPSPLGFCDDNLWRCVSIEYLVSNSFRRPPFELVRAADDDCRSTCAKEVISVL